MYLQLQIPLGLRGMRCSAAWTLTVQNPVVYKASVPTSPADSADSKTQNSNYFFWFAMSLYWKKQLATGVSMLLRSFNYQLCFITFLYYLRPTLFHIPVMETGFWLSCSVMPGETKGCALCSFDHINLFGFIWLQCSEKRYKYGTKIRAESLDSESESHAFILIYECSY